MSKDLDFSLLSEEDLQNFITSYFESYPKGELSDFEYAQRLYKTIGKRDLPLPILDLEIASSLEFERRYVYAKKDLEKMDSNSVQRFAKLLNLSVDKNTKQRIIRILNYAGFVVDPKQLISPSRSVAIKFSPWDPENPQNLVGNADFVRFFPKQGIFYIADTVGHNYEEKGQMPKLEKISKLWSEVDDQILSGKVSTDQQILGLYQQLHKKFLSEGMPPEEAIAKSSTFTIGRLTIESGVLSFFTGSQRKLKINSVGDNSMIVVPVQNRLAGNSLLLSGKGNKFAVDSINEQSAELKTPMKDMWEKMTSSELGGNFDKMQDSDYNLPNNDVYLFAMTDGVKDVLYDGPIENFNFRTAKDTSEYANPFLQNQVQIAIDSDWSVSELAASIQAKVLENYRIYSDKGVIREKDLDDCSLMIIYLPCLNPTDCWKESVEYLLSEISKLTGEKLTYTKNPEVAKILKTCDVSWKTLPYDQRRDWCERIARIYSLLIYIPLADNRILFGNVLERVKELNRIGIDNWVARSEKVNFIIGLIEKSLNQTRK